MNRAELLEVQKPLAVGLKRPEVKLPGGAEEPRARVVVYSAAPTLSFYPRPRCGSAGEGSAVASRADDGLPLCSTLPPRLWPPAKARGSWATLGRASAMGSDEVSQKPAEENGLRAHLGGIRDQHERARPRSGQASPVVSRGSVLAACPLVGSGHRWCMPCPQRYRTTRVLLSSFGGSAQ